MKKPMKKSREEVKNGAKTPNDRHINVKKIKPTSDDKCQKIGVEK